jgi:hypothetical protein
MASILEAKIAPVGDYSKTASLFGRKNLQNSQQKREAVSVSWREWLFPPTHRTMRAREIL